MKITFLGSAAAECIPTPFCDCATCLHAREHKGKNIRKRCSYKINDDMLVDLGPDLFAACAMYGIDLLKTTYFLVTHNHMDHFHHQNLELRTKMFRKDTELPTLTFIAPPSVMGMLSNSRFDDKSIELRRIPILPYEQVELSHYHIETVKASHNPMIGDALNYLIDDGASKLLLASDTGIYGDKVWQRLQGALVNGLIIESTFGTAPSQNVNHLNINGVMEMVNRLKKIDAISERTSIFATHFSHHYCPPHEELHEIFKGFGITCVYDGLVVEI